MDGLAKSPERIFIVAGGPSARGFDFRQLRGEYIIAVNDVFLSIPESHAVVSIDREWIIDRAPELIRFPGELFTLHREGEPRPWTRAGQRCWHYESQPGLSESWDHMNTVGCSGSAALNVAYLMRPKFIGLIGFDYDGTGDHWYQSGTRPTNSTNTWARWATGFDGMKAQIEDAAIEVINYSHTSRIYAFPRMPLAKWLLSYDETSVRFLRR